MFAPLRNVVVGAVSIAEMFGPQGPITDKSLAEKRAATCAACPKNEKGDWTRYFTVPLSRALRSALSLIKKQGMETSRDADLRVCTACDCPCGLKIWARLPHILNHMPKENYDALDHNCWVLSEEKQP